MSYIIKETTQNEDTITTLVEYTLGDTVLEVSIPHFRPSSAQDVLDGIANREVSEQAKLDAAAVASQVLTELNS